MIRHGVLRPLLLVGGGLSQLTGPTSVLVVGQIRRNVAYLGKCYSLREYGQPGLRTATFVKDVGIMVICRPS